MFYCFGKCFFILHFLFFVYLAIQVMFVKKEDENFVIFVDDTVCNNIFCVYFFDLLFLIGRKRTRDVGTFTRNRPGRIKNRGIHTTRASFI